MAFQPTEEQQAVAAAAGARTGSAMVRAFAGCAKSSTLELAGKAIKVPALGVAFNKKTAEEMRPRFAGNFSIKTMNGLGMSAWGRAQQGLTLEIDTAKLGKLVTQTAKDRKVELSSDQWADLRQLASKAMQAGIVSEGSGPEGLVADHPDSWQEIADDMLMSADDFYLLADLAKDIVKQDIALARQGKLSFDDQIYCSTLLGGKFPQFPVVMVDEAQDLSPLNHLMVAKCLRPDGRVIAVGDPKQAIYGFRGADHSSMDSLRQVRPEADWTDLPLATTFRCPRVIVDRQQEHAPGFKAWHSNVEGSFENWQVHLGYGLDSEDSNCWSWDSANTEWRLIDLLQRPDSKLAVLCRNNGPLLGLAFKLLRQGTGVVMLGRDIGKGLVALSRKLAKEDSTPADAVRAAVVDWQTAETSLALANGKEEKVVGIADRAECLRAVLDSGAVSDAGSLRRALERLFSRESGAVQLGSIHRAKGLEWDAVVHLDSWRIPSKWAREAAAKGDERQLEQELNLRYVVETRTRDVLVNANLEDFR